MKTLFKLKIIMFLFNFPLKGLFWHTDETNGVETFIWSMSLTHNIKKSLFFDEQNKEQLKFIDFVDVDSNRDGVVIEIRSILNKIMEQNSEGLYNISLLPVGLLDLDGRYEFRCLFGQMRINDIKVESLVDKIKINLNLLNLQYNGDLTSLVYLKFFINKKNEQKPTLGRRKHLERNNNESKISGWNDIDNLDLLPRMYCDFDGDKNEYNTNNIVKLGYVVWNTDNIKSYILNRYGVIKNTSGWMGLYTNDECYLYFKDYKLTNKWGRVILRENKKYDKGYVFTFIEYDNNNVIQYLEAECSKVNYIKPLDYLSNEERKQKDDITIFQWNFKDCKYIAYDIETYKDDKGDLIPYAVGSCYGGDYNYLTTEYEFNKYYITDFDGETIKERATNMILKSIKDILIPKFRGYSVYCHNLGGFDGPLLIKYLKNIKHLKIKPLYRNNSVYSIDISYPICEMDENWIQYGLGKRGGSSLYNKQKYVRLVFKDSYKHLPFSLDSLTKMFGTVSNKGVFPHDFVSIDTLNYIGQEPDGVINDGTYEKGQWNLKEECLWYLQQDLQCLSEVLIAYEKGFLRKWGVNIHKYLTLPSLAMGVYRRLFMPKNAKIPILKGNIEKHIRSSYRGGIVEVYKPYVKDGYYYDVNSLYPKSMLNHMPVGDPKYIYKPDLKSFFGFCQAYIECPKHIDKPFLTIKAPDGRILSPVGKWDGWYFSEELKYAESIGYKIKPICGYKFERGLDLFDKYVNTFYEQKKNAPSDEHRVQAKLMLNSLYGRFGMVDYDVDSGIFNQDEFNRLGNTNEIKSYHYLDDSIHSDVLVEYKKTPNIDLCESDHMFINYMNKADIEKRHKTTSIGIAAAITAYARIHMHVFTSRNDCCYTDTDSVVLKYPLHSKYVNDQLGSMKLVYGVKEGFFIRPKLYGILTYKGNQIIKLKGVPQKLVKMFHIHRLFKGKSVTFNTERMYRHKFKGITVKNVLITIQPPTNRKRVQLFNHSGVWDNTKPIQILKPPDN